MEISPLNDAPLASRAQQSVIPSPAAEAVGVRLLPMADTEGYVTQSLRQLAALLEVPETLGVEFAAVTVYHILERLGWAMAPDFYFDGRMPRRFEETVVAYRRSTPLRVRTVRYKRGLTLVKLATLVLQQLTAEEIAQIGNYASEGIGVPGYADHLRALTRFYANRRRLLDAPTRLYAAALPPEVRELMADRLIRLAAGRQTLDAGAVTRLERVLGVLGQDPASLHSLLHAAATQSAIPLDAEQVKNETKIAQELLSQVFDVEKIESEKSSVAQGVPSVISLAHALAAREEWDRAEAESLAQEYGLALSGALEAINDLAIEKFDDTAIEDASDRLYVVPDYLKLL